jgi:group II intron reverse transcriptase/maturase
MPVEGASPLEGVGFQHEGQGADMPYTEMEGTWSKLPLIAKHAREKPDMQFTSLAHLLDKRFLTDSFHSLNRNKAVGVDNVSWEDYGKNLEANLEDLHRRLKGGSYIPIPAKRVYIPKSETEFRPIGIPAIENNIVVRSVVWILEQIYEQVFHDCSHGFRPGRNCHQALRRVHDLISLDRVNHIVEADIKGFFDNVPHKGLMDMLRVRIKDSSMLTLIQKFLDAGYIEDGLPTTSDAGTPQGGILSPLLANIYLHYALDEWFEKTVKRHVKGLCELVRYADDFVCLVQYAGDAEKVERALRLRLEKFGLEIHPTKSRRFSFGKFEAENAKRTGRKPNRFDFLGFTHFCDKSRKGFFKLGRTTSRKKFTAKCKAMNDWLRKVRNSLPTPVWWKTLRAKLRGHYQYYGVSENIHGISAFYHRTLCMAKKWLNRRSQKGRGQMSWEDFNGFVKSNPLPVPHIVHSFYA